MRIWLTGVGVCSPLAQGARLTMDRLCLGHRAFAPVTLFDISQYRTQIAAQVLDLPVSDIAPKGQPGWSRTDAMALVAAREALQWAGLSSQAGLDLVVGGTTGGTLESEEALAQLHCHPLRASDLTRPITHTLTVTTDRVAGVLGPFRNIRTASSACSTGVTSILVAAQWLRSGRSRRVLVGAADGLCRLTYTGFSSLGSLDPQPCRPFDKSRAGLTLGEGAAFLVLETEEAAKERGAEPIAELVGWAAGAEAHHITNPQPDGSTAASVMRQALAISGLSQDDIDYVNAHGTATVLNDVMEVRALRSFLGAHINRVPVSSSKGQIGHTLGAAGAIEAAIAALSVYQGRIPPTGGLIDPADDCQAVHVLKTAQAQPVRVAMSNSFGFGGLDGVLLLARPNYAPEPKAQARRKVVVLAGASLSPLGLQDLADAKQTLEPGPGPNSGPLSVDPSEGLDLSRARRLGRAERMLCLVMQSCLKSVGMQSLPEGIGLIAAKPSGGPDATARFLQRVKEKGPRAALPADFPNLMLSSTVGHASIYQQIHGPTVATTELGLSGGASLLTAWELLESGPQQLMLSAVVDEWGMTGRVLSEESPEQVYSEGASCLLLSTQEQAERLGLSAQAQIVDGGLWHNELGKEHVLGALPSPKAGARVIRVGKGTEALLEASEWAAVESIAIEDRVGTHEAALGIALVACISWLKASKGQVLLIASAPERGFALVLT